MNKEGVKFLQYLRRSVSALSWKRLTNVFQYHVPKNKISRGPQVAREPRIEGTWYRCSCMLHILLFYDVLEMNNNQLHAL